MTNHTTSWVPASRADSRAAGRLPVPKLIEHPAFHVRARHAKTFSGSRRVIALNRPDALAAVRQIPNRGTLVPTLQEAA